MFITVSSIREDHPVEIKGSLDNDWVRDSFSELDCDVKSFNFFLTLEKKGEFIALSGQFSGKGNLNCVRCLKKFEKEFEDKFRLFLYYEDSASSGGGEHELNSEDLEFDFLHGDRIDIGEILREQLLLSLPDYPLCNASCQGGYARSDGEEHDDSKKSFSNLKNLKLKD